MSEKDARQPAMLLAANNNPANAELARHAASFHAAGGRSQAGTFKLPSLSRLTPHSPRGLRMRCEAAVAVTPESEIQSSSMRRRKIWPRILPLLFTAAFAFSPIEQACAAEGSTFIIAATEGYGVEDCLAEHGECGRVVADAWCEAHGHGAAISFGSADDVTSAISGDSAHATGAPYFVSCGE
jgi:hypothetical protein